jgi:hypothetical protein
VLTISSVGATVTVKLGDGTAKWNTTRQMQYDLNRGVIDTVHEGDDVPMDLEINASWEYVRSSSGEAISPVEAVSKTGAAAGWVSTGELWEPYAVNVTIVFTPAYGATAGRIETYFFPDFRCEKSAFTLENANIVLSGRCNATVPTITRS